MIAQDASGPNPGSVAKNTPHSQDYIFSEHNIFAEHAKWSDGYTGGYGCTGGDQMMSHYIHSFQEIWGEPRYNHYVIRLLDLIDTDFNV
jgi:hypothetical protein